MIHFGLICPEGGGHLNPFIALAAELRRRGHRVTFFLRPLGREKVQAAGFDCRAYGEREFPVDASRARLAEMATKRGFAALTFTIARLRDMIAVALTEVPHLARDDGVDAIMVDEAIASIGATIAEAVRVPHIVMSTALVTCIEPEIPPFWTSWSYRTEWWAVLRNRVAYRCFAIHARRARPVFAEYRRRLGLPASSESSPVVHISHQPPGFDYPRRAWPAHLRWTGPLIDSSVRAPIAFPFEQLDGRPVVYAVLGSILGVSRGMFRCIAHACAGLPVQLVISLGGSASAAELGKLPGDPLVVDSAPQLELLKRASLCINHAGMNTVIECLAHGVPIVALPIMNDGPGTAARIVRSGCGEMVQLSELNPPRLRDVIRRVLDEPRYRDAAARMRDTCREAGGLTRAVDIIEQACEAR